MRDETNSATITPPQPKPSRKRRATTSRAPRQIDPGVAAIRADATLRIQEYHRQQHSGAVLKRIQKDFVRLTTQHKEALFDELKEFFKNPANASGHS